MRSANHIIIEIFKHSQNSLRVFFILCIIVNSVSFVDGKKLHENIGDFVKLEKFCNTCYARIKGKYSYISKKLKTF